MDINFCNENGANGHTNTLRLLQEGADINFCSKGGTSPFYVACQNEYKTIVHILLNNGVGIYAMNMKQVLSM